MCWRYADLFFPEQHFYVKICRSCSFKAHLRNRVDHTLKNAVKHIFLTFMLHLVLVSFAERQPGNPEYCGSLSTAAEGDCILLCRSLLAGSTFHRHHLRPRGRRLVNIHQRLCVNFTFCVYKNKPLRFLVEQGAASTELCSGELSNFRTSEYT